MDEAKRGYRDAETNAKEAWRNRDGEDLADKVGNAGDEVRKELGNAGDEMRHQADEADRTIRNPERRGIDDPDLKVDDPTRPM